MAGTSARSQIALAIGGVPINRQVRALARGVEVLVATPGRLLDLVNQRALRLDQVEVLVLDEADRMLDMGFIHDIKKIVAMLPKQRQTLFFSATMPQEITKLADAMLREPARVAVTPQATTVDRVEQRVILTEKASKPALLAEVLKTEKIDRVLVFTRTKHGADKVVRGLQKAGHRRRGDPRQQVAEPARARARRASATAELRTLIATDIAARGIDVDGVSHVINYDLPNIPESYVHRIGRTARAGAEGVAISFCDHEERAVPARHRAADPHGDPLDRPAHRRAGRAMRPRNRQRPAMAADRIAASNSAVSSGGGHGRPGNNGHRSHNGGNGRQGRPSQNGHQAAHPAGRHGRGAKRHRKCYIPASARTSRAATPATGAR